MTRHPWLVVCLAMTLAPGLTRADGTDDRSSCVLEWYFMGSGGGVSRGDGLEVEGIVSHSGAGLFWSTQGLPWDDDGDDDRAVLASHGNRNAGENAAHGTMATPITEFSLSPISPNPSSGVAQISWATPVRSRVKLTVHDVQGRGVATLADGEYQAGRYQVTWNNLRPGGPPGLYFVRLQTPERVFVRRVVMTR